MTRLSAVLAALLALSAPALAAGVVPAEERYHPFSGELPRCDDKVVLWKVTSHFADKERGYWNSDLSIDEVVDTREIGYRANGVSVIPRRFCVGTAKMSDKKDRKVIYDVIQSGGFAGILIGVESCVVGYDRNLAYAPSCGVLRPILDRYSGEKIQLKYP